MEYEEEDIVCLFLSQTAVQMLERKVKGGGGGKDEERVKLFNGNGKCVIDR